MKRPLTVLALSAALAAGSLVGYQASERHTQGAAAPLASAASAAPQGQMVQAVNHPADYDQGRARTESEANTVGVVKARQNGLVYVNVTEGSSAGAQAQRLQEQFGLPELPGGQQSGTGSGFFVSSAGDIITNNHVVEGASEITIRLHGSKQVYKARVVARAPDFDLALIRAEGVPKADIQPLPLGDSAKLDVGLKAIAMGAPFGLDFSVSEGIISSLERTVPVGTKEVNQQVIQTDAAINPGNSGGPLLNSAGEVIGVNTQILTGGIGQSAGVGFAIPVNTVKKLLPQLQAGRGGVIRTPTLGIQFTDLSALSPDERKKFGLPDRGALLQQVYPGSPAARAGLKAGTRNASAGSGSSAGGAGGQIATDGDVITAVDGQAITEGDDLRRAVIGKQIGDRLTLSVQHGSKTREVMVALQAFDFPQQARPQP